MNYVQNTLHTCIKQYIYKKCGKHIVHVIKIDIKHFLFLCKSYDMKKYFIMSKCIGKRYFLKDKMLLMYKSNREN